MDINEAKKIIVTFYTEKFKNRNFISIIPLLPFSKNNSFIVIWETNFSWTAEPILEITYFIIQNNTAKKFVLLGYTKESEYLNNYFEQREILFFQLEKFRIGNKYAFIYDFTHSGVNSLLNFEESGAGNEYLMIFINPLTEEVTFPLHLEVDYFSWQQQRIEFINYKCKQGIKYFDGEQFVFYYYDRIKQEYVQDESASSEELEQIHGSPDFFAEAGIDYTKLERPLLSSDLEGFSKPALRIWRNAIYARHGRTFKSEDLQALFNEYIWYKPDENYSDEKLTDIDKANIKLIQEFEKNKK